MLPVIAALKVVIAVCENENLAAVPRVYPFASHLVQHLRPVPSPLPVSKRLASAVRVAATRRVVARRVPMAMAADVEASVLRVVVQVAVEVVQTLLKGDVEPHENNQPQAHCDGVHFGRRPQR